MNSKIITFYSFKGGVGRTMALATIAVILAKRGRRILAIDWDLEAPGLSRYFDAFPRKKQGLGFLALIRQYLYSDDPSNNLDYIYNFASVYVIREGVELDVIESGDDIQSGYASDLAEFRWEDFYRSGGGDFLERLRNQLRNFYDIILIDSRTGLSDSGGICTIQMPDIVVAMFTPNMQSIYGVRDVMSLARAARNELAFDRMTLMVLPWPTRFGKAIRSKVAEEWVDRIADAFGEWYKDWLPASADCLEFVRRTAIPNDDWFLYGERLALHGESDAVAIGLEGIFQKIATMLESDSVDASDLFELPERKERSLDPQNAKKLVQNQDGRLARTVRKESGYAYDIFASYSGRPRVASRVERLLTLIKKRIDPDYRIFFEIRALESDALWMQRHSDVILRSRIMLAFIDEDYWADNWARASFDSFRRRERIIGGGCNLIVPVLLEPQGNDKYWVDGRRVIDLTSIAPVDRALAPSEATSHQEAVLSAAISQQIEARVDHVDRVAPKVDEQWMVVDPHVLDAPYNFVPLSQHVLEPGWASEISLDIPFSDGLNGVLEIEIEAHSPLCVGGRHRKPEDGKPGHVSFFRLPDHTLIEGSDEDEKGTPAIPGSSVRGMIRNVMEIACFGRMSLIDDRRFSLRDLTGAAKVDYQQRIVGKSKAGWLYFEQQGSERGWRIQPCRFGRITHDEIAKAGKFKVDSFARPHRGSKGANDKERWPQGSAPAKYALWEKGAIGTLSLPVIEGPPRDPQFNRDVPECRIADGQKRSGATSGTLVFTGQPNRMKKREFVFLDPVGTARNLPSKVWQAFVDIHEAQHASVEWQYWRDKHFADPTVRIPVFYIEEKEEIDALGLAMMFKLAGKHSTHDLRNDRQSPAQADQTAASDDKTPPPPLDLVEAIFGRVGEKPEHALRGRIAFGTAALANPDDVEFGKEQPAVLGSPKPSYFPTYLRQPIDPVRPTKLRGHRYSTYMSDRAELAGWKRYPVHPLDQVGLPALNDANREARQVQIELETLRGRGGARPRFKSRLHVHNLRPIEFGAVLWALRFGERDTHRHAIGMAKPHGFGQVQITLGPKALATALSCNDGSTLSVGECLKRFCAHMKDWADKAGIPGSWEGSLQVQRLLAMAEPRSALTWPGRLRHMTLDPGNRVNEFVEAKRQKLVLAPYGDIALEQQRPPIAAKSAAAGSPRPAPAETARPAVAAPAPRAFGVVRHAAGTRVECAGDRGRLAEDWIDGVSKVLVTFDDGDDEVAVEAIVVLKG